MNDPTLELLLKKLDRIERANRRLRLAATLVLTVFVGGPLMGQTKPARVPKVIEAEAFALRDQSGKLRAQFSIFVEPLSRPDQSIPMLVFYDSAGKTRAVLRVLDNGATFLEFTHPDEQHPRASLGVSPDGTPALVLTDKDEMARVGIGVPGELPKLVATDRAGKTIWQAP